MSVAALFMIAKIWKQPHCSLMDGWIRKCVIHTCVYIYMHAIEHYLAFKEEGNPAICDSMDGP